METSGRLGVAIFGLGRAGTIHFYNVIKEYSLTLLYVVEEREEHARNLVAKCSQNQCTVVHPDDQSKVFNDDRVDFVMVATPTFLHTQIVLDALTAGKGVFCEKPIAENETDVIKCYDKAAETGKPLFCSFNRRYDPSVRTVYNSLSDVGQLQVVKTCARDSPLPPMGYLKISGGVFHDCLVHDIDMICWVLGEYPTHVYAAASSFIGEIGEMGDVDTVAATMKFKSGALAIIDTSRDAKYGYDQRLEVFGEKGMLLNQNQRPNNMVLENTDGLRMGRMYNSFHDRYELSYIAALQHFCRVMKGEENLEVTKEVTLNVSKIATVMEESSKTGEQLEMTY